MILNKQAMKPLFKTVSMNKPAWSQLTMVVVLAAVLAVALTLGGCLKASGTAKPSAVYVPHPTRIDAELTGPRLMELYSTSPNRNPDGLGPLTSIWLNSHITLMVWPIEKHLEEKNRIAYARTEKEQSKVLRKGREKYQSELIFEGVFVSYFRNPVSPYWYLPEGVYLVDDKGMKHMPLLVEEGPADFNLEAGYIKTAQGGQFYSRAVYFGYPVVVFPAKVLGPQTKALHLYFAQYGKRMKFTWIFDPAYVPPESTLPPELQPVKNRLFRGKSQDRY